MRRSLIDAWQLRRAVADPYQPIDALQSCRTTGSDPSRSASTELPFVAYGGWPSAVAHSGPVDGGIRLD
jgi:hypothetical protein